MSKVANLSVHRNTKERRKRRQTSDRLVNSARNATSDKNVSGYVLLSWDEELTCHVDWVQGSVPQRALPDFARGVLQSKFSMDDSES